MRDSSSALPPTTLNPKELGNTYVGNRDRFVVSLIVGYATDDGPTTPLEAVKAALSLTTDDGSYDTQWYCFDRQTGILHMIEQGNAEEYHVPELEPCDECGTPIDILAELPDQKHDASCSLYTEVKP